jgi:hypothetical protein
MSFSEIITHQIKKFLCGDGRFLGILRLTIFVVIPSLFFILVSWWSIFGAISNVFRQVILIYFFALISAFAASVAYIKDIYEEETDRIPFRHFVACFFGLFIPKIKISNRIQDSAWKEMVEKIGGPAILNIEAGYAVLTETLTSPAHIYGQGSRHFISHQERVYEIIDLHEQEGSIPKVTAWTKDGIEVTAANVKFNYRLWDSQWERYRSDQAKVKNPFPFSKEAIHNYVYNRFVSVDEHGKQKSFSWPSVVSGRIQGIIRDYITERRLDDVIASREYEQKNNPREEIRDIAYQPRFEASLRTIGTTLRWWDPGEFRSLGDIESQFLSNWSVDFKSNVRLNQAYGEAQKQAYEELGRAEAEAELLMSIIHALDGIKFASDKTQTLQNLILMRTAQVIKALNTPAEEKKSSESVNKKQEPNGKEAK